MSKEVLDELQTTTKNLLVVQPADVVCATCQQQYCDFLSSVLERQAELVEVNEALQPFVKQNRSSSTTGSNKPDRCPLPGYCLVSTAFVNQLKNLVRWRRKLLQHPGRCTVAFYKQCDRTLDPTANLLCVGEVRAREA